jgi:hypothetical protein
MVIITTGVTNSFDERHHRVINYFNAFGYQLDTTKKISNKHIKY